jgi:hypothetical protein
LEMLNQRDDVAATIAAAAVPDLFSDIDRKPIDTAAHWAGTALIDLALEMDSALRNLIFDANSTSVL